jgi:hypothetical protein
MVGQIPHPILLNLPPKQFSNPQNNIGMATAVQDTQYVQVLKMHKEYWAGAINLDETHVQQLHQMFKYVQCHSNEHTLPSCPLKKNWNINKMTQPDLDVNSTHHNYALGGVKAFLLYVITPIPTLYFYHSFY